MNLKTTTPQRLFALRDINTGKLLPNTFFTDKRAAKTARDAGGAHLRVTPGPDHWRYDKQH